MSQAAPPRWRWGDAALGGLVWLGLHFVGDSVDSARMIRASTRRIRTDEATTQVLVDGVLDYVVGVAAGYVLLGALAGVLLGLALRVWFVTAPSRRRWWTAGAVLAATVSLVGNLKQAVLFPALHDWFPARRWWADHVEPWYLDAAAVGLVLIAAGAVLRRWRPHGWVPLLRRAVPLVAYLVGVAWLLRHPAPAQAQANDGPNVVIIGIDSLRPDHLASAGYFRDTAPRIDAFLEEAAVFDSAWTPLARTYPAWISLLSGTLPITHGVRDNLPEPSDSVPEHVSLLPRLLQEEGWHTRWVTDDSRFSYMVPELGFDALLQPRVGPQNFAVSVNEPRYRAFYGLLYNPIGFGLVPTAAYNQAFGKSYRPDFFVAAAVDQLAQASEHDRFFYAAHSCVLHAPGDRAWPWHQHFGQAGYTGPNRFRYSRSGTDLVHAYSSGGAPVDEIAEQDIRIYDSGIDMADRLVGAVMDELERGDLLDDTIVVLLSDHGEMLWEPLLAYDYNGPNHGFHPYGDAQFRVLLAVRFPDGAHAGQRVAAPVRLQDVAPTLAEHLGLAWPGPLDGASLLPLLTGAETGEQPRPVYIETGLSESRYWPPGHRSYPFQRVSERYRVDLGTGRVHVRAEFQPHLIAAKDRVYQVGPWKLVYRPQEEGARVELYDRSEDVPNIHDFSRIHAERTAALVADLAPYLALDGAPMPDVPPPRVLPTPPASPDKDEPAGAPQSPSSPGG